MVTRHATRNNYKPLSDDSRLLSLRFSEIFYSQTKQHDRNETMNCSSVRVHNTNRNSHRLDQATTMIILTDTKTVAAILQNTTAYFADSIFLTMCAVFSLALMYSGRFLFKSFSSGYHTNCQLTFINNILSQSLTKKAHYTAPLYYSYNIRTLEVSHKPNSITN